MRAAAFAIALAVVQLGCATAGPRSGTGAIEIGPLPESQAAQHQTIIQNALDRAAATGRCVQLAPGDYHFTDTRGVRVPSGTTLLMTGARIILDEGINEDGQAFLLEDAKNVVFEGGEIVGARGKWTDDVNVAGIRAYGAVENLRIRGTRFRDLSSNAIGVFGKDDEQCARNVVVDDVDVDNCCNVYIDYLMPGKGPAKGTVREDQGGIALYYVDGWSVQGCRFTRSQSDGTHFFHSHNGTFANSLVATSKMGGYFIEGCRNVTASGNRMIGNGSRGCTIERDSLDCLLQNNIVTQSGREGLWAPDVEDIIVSGNVFRDNGQKDDGEKDCEIRLDDTAEFAAVTRNVRIESNIIGTRDVQTAAIYLGKGVNALIQNNTVEGPATQVVEEK